jgi:hypothetical protein
MLLAAVFTLIIINYSFSYGRLSMSSTYDDVGYLTDALERLNVLYTKGWVALVKTFINDPMHAPYSTLCGLMSFALLGVEDWAPYVTNGLIIFFVLYVIGVILEGVPLLVVIACDLFVLGVPVMGYTVHEFRPDFVVGALTAAAVAFMVISGCMPGSDPKRRTVAGLLFGIGLVSKPTMFPATFVFMVATLAVVTWRDLFVAKERRTVRNILQEWSLCLVPALAISLPMLSWKRHIWYIYGTTFGVEKDIWAVKGGVFDQLLYYWSGSGGAEELGSHAFLLALLIVLGNIVLYKERRDEWRRELVPLCLLLGVSYLVPSLVAHKGPTLASAFYFLSLLTVTYVLGHVWGTFGTSRPGVVWILFGAMVLFSAWQFRFPSFIKDPLVKEVKERKGDFKRRLKEIEGAVMADMVCRDFTKDRRSFCTFAGVFNGWTLQYSLLKSGYYGSRGPDLHRKDDLALYARAFDSADFVLAAESGNEYVFEWLPGGRVLDKTLALIKERGDFLEVGCYRTMKGKAYYLFRKKTGFWGYEWLENFGDPEGPYPEWKLPVVRWGLGPVSSIAFTAKGKGDVRLFVTGMTRVPGQEIVVKLDGREVKTLHFDDVNVFSDFDLIQNCSEGPHRIDMYYRRWHEPEAGDKDPRRLGVLFKSLLIEEMGRTG